MSEPKGLSDEDRRVINERLDACSRWGDKLEPRAAKPQESKPQGESA